MRAVKTATVWSLGTMLTPGRVLRMGFICAADFEVTVRLVMNGVEKVAPEVCKPRGQLSAFIIYGDVYIFASTDAPLNLLLR